MVIKNSEKDLEIFFFNGKRARHAYKLLLSGSIKLYFDPQDGQINTGKLVDEFDFIKKEDLIYIYFSGLDIFVNLSKYLNEFSERSENSRSAVV